MTEREFSFKIDVPVRNEWANVSLLVTSVQNCFNAMFSDMDGSQTVAMVTGELLENAIKYGRWTTGGHYLRLSVGGGAKRALVSVENPVESDEVIELLRTLEWIRSFPSAEAAYRARLLALAQTTDPDVSKLGLIRVAYEGRCTLNATAVGEAIRVTADLVL